jgi:hypothetical protein
MTCIHGLDQANCPICRIEKAMVPSNSRKIEKLYENPLDPKNPFLNENGGKNKEIEEQLKLKRLNANKDKFIIPKVPQSFNKLPDFKNQMFLERLKEIDITKSKDFKIPEKKTLESPKWEFKND